MSIHADVARHTTYFATVPEWLLGQVSSNAIAVYCVLDRKADRQGRAWPSRSLIAETLNVSEATVKRAIAELVAVGAITRTERFREDGGRTSNDYVLLRDPPRVSGDSGGRGAGDPTENQSQLEPDSVPTGTGVNAPDTAHTLVAEIIDSAKNHGVPLSRRSIGHFAKEIHVLLNEGFDPDTIRAGLQRMAQKGKLQPALLAGFASETRLPTSQPLRYGRGLTTAQILELGRSMNGDTGTGG